MAREAWDKLDAESPEAFEAFAAFRDSGKTLAAVGQDFGKSKRMMEYWSRTHAWAERRNAWITAQDQAKTRATLKLIGDTAEERQANVERMNERHAGAAMLLLRKVTDALSKIKAEQLAPKDLARIADVAVKIERLARGVSTESVVHTGPDGGAIEVDIHEAARERVSGICGEILAARAASELVGKPN